LSQSGSTRPAVELKSFPSASTPCARKATEAPIGETQSSTVVRRIQPLGGYHRLCSGQILGSVNGFLAQNENKE
jgi:hypothetical protein